MRLPVTLFALSVSLLSSVFSGEPPRADVPEDPTLWSPPQKRPIAAPVPPDSPELKARLEVAIKRADEYARELATYPSHGIIITEMPKGAPAEKLNVKLRDVIMKIDDIDVMTDLKPLRKPVPQKLKVYRYGEPELVIEIPPGPLGIFSGPYRPPTIPEIGTVPAGEGWNTQIATFKKVYFTDPALAEIELIRALAAGLPPSAQTDAWFAELALNQWQFARAMDFAWLAIDAGAKDRRVFDTFLSAATATCKMQAARDVRAMRPFGDDENKPSNVLDQFVDAHAALPKEQRVFISPLAEAKALLKDDLLLRATKLPLLPNADNFIDSLASRGEVQMSAESDTYQTVHFGPPAKDIMLTCRFKMRPKGPGTRVNAQHMRFQFNALAKGRWVKSEVQVGIYEHETSASAMSAQLFSRTYNWASNSDPEHIHELRMAVVNGRVECELDGTRIFYSILPEGPAELIPCIFACGTTIDVRSVRVDALFSDADYRAVVKDDINALFKDGQTRLHRAAAAGRIAEARILLELGADPKIADKNSQMPLHLAAQAGDREMLILLLEKDGASDYVIAGAVGDREMLTKLKAEQPKDKKLSTWTALHGAAAAGQLDLIKELIAQGTKVDAETSGSKETPLMWAARAGQMKACELLRASGASVAKQDSRKRTAAEHARWSGLPESGGLLAAPAAPVRPPAPPADKF